MHAGVLLNCLNGINDFNKKILSNLEHLKEKYEKLNSEINNIKINRNNSSSEVNPHATLNTYSTIPPTNVSAPQVQSNIQSEDIELKFDYLEQQGHSNVLMCTGDIISKALSDTNITSLREFIFAELKQNIYPNIQINDIARVNNFGKNKKSLKIIFSSEFIKIKILHSVRQKKPQNIYFYEFLTSFRSNLYYELRQLKRKYPDKICAAYTRNGSIFYKLSSENNKYYKVCRLTDIHELMKKIEILSNDYTSSSSTPEPVLSTVASSPIE